MEVAQVVQRALEAHRPLRLGRLCGSAPAYLAARLRASHPGPLVIVCATSTRARDFAAALGAFLDPADVGLLPRYDTPPYDRFSPHPEIEARRMSWLYRLLASDAGTPLTLVTPISALLRRVPPRSEIRERVTHLERGRRVDRDALLQVLISAGYHRTTLVEERGEVAVRGGVLDLYPPQLERPVRLEFDFDEIGSMRSFDPGTQRSQDELDSAIAIPPRAFRLPHDLEPLLQGVRQRGREARLPESQIYTLTEALGRRHLPPGIENLEPVLHDVMETVFDYLPEGTRVLVDDPESTRQRAAKYADEVAAAQARARAQDRLVASPLELYLTDDDAWSAVLRRRPLLLDALGTVDASADEERLTADTSDHRELRRSVAGRRGAGRALQPLAERLTEWSEAGRRVRLLCPSPSACERIVDILGDYGFELPLVLGESDVLARLPEPGVIDVATGSLAEGFEWPDDDLVLVTEQDVFGQRVRHRPVRASATRRGQAIERLAQIGADDLLVHAQHGICRYGGLAGLQAGGIDQEFLMLRFRDDDKLYIPVAQLDQVQSYAASEGAMPPLDRLGGQSWAKRKKRARKAVRYMADELLAVTAARQALQGFSYPPPDADYEEFEARFPYEDTPDQRRATEEVLADMQREQPMDRVVCGDVGFGKTEVACRATYMAVSSGRQVAVLVPTTVLCQQHLESLRERFADEPVRIESFSRLTPPSKLREIRDGLASGAIDIVIGTHRLLSKDVQLRNLGLVVIDEEHRFGVAHKERLKQLRKLVDVLTLTATPIPRTLHMAFSGMRDLSVITTPPPDRVAVRTQVCRFGDEIVREAIERELRRGGQVFFVHNRVETIEEIAGYLRRLLPDARFDVGHGQMPATRLEKVMLRFMRREFDVLVCTAIIESGLDIPNANTILIHHADHFGLAQLYQLRGRVGRSDRRAHAYLFVPPEGQMTPDARRRIEALQELSDLGAGFRLATEDLEIRGAGNLLGAEQSGHISAIGYDLYMDMLEEAIEHMRGAPSRDDIEPEIRLPLPALLPVSYVGDTGQRLVLYKQLSSARDADELGRARADLLDRFGPLPPEAENLVGVIGLRLACRRLGIETVDVRRGELVLGLAESARIDPHCLARLIDKPGTPLRVTPDHRIWLRLRAVEDALVEGIALLELLDPAAGSAAAASESALGGAA